jgi:hypothetical protein
MSCSSSTSTSLPKSETITGNATSNKNGSKTVEECLADGCIAFTNLLGYKCVTRSKKVIEYNLGMLDIFTDNITMDLIKFPVILKDSPVEIYDRDNIVTWFLSSNKDPMTGKEITGKVEFSHCLNVTVAMMLLERTENNLVFHIPDIDLINLFELVAHVISSNNRKKLQLYNFLGVPPDIILDSNVVELDIESYYHKPAELRLDQSYHSYKDYTNAKIKGKDQVQVSSKTIKRMVANCIGLPCDFGKSKIYFEDHLTYDLADILLNDVITGEPLVTAILNEGKIMNRTTLRRTGGRRSETLDYWIFYDNDDCEYPNCNIIITKLRAIFKQYGASEAYMEKEMRLKDQYYDFSNIFDYQNHRGLACRASDFYINSLSTAERMFQTYSTLVTDKVKLEKTYPNFEKKRSYLSSLVKSNPRFITQPNVDDRLDHYRHKICFPVLTNLGYYTDDLSLLDLSETIFRAPGRHDSITEAYVKGFEFIGCNLTRTRFRYIQFSVCSFVASECSHLKFSYCTFKECLFYKNNGTSIEFVGCQIDLITESRLKAEYGNRFRIISDKHVKID